MALLIERWVGLFRSAGNETFTGQRGWFCNHEGGLQCTKLSAVAFALVALVAGANLAKADQPGPNWMPAQQVIEKVLKSGYTLVTELKAGDGRWEGEGIKDGKKMDFHADPKTGVITSEKLDD